MTASRLAVVWAFNVQRVAENQIQLGYLDERQLVRCPLALHHQHVPPVILIASSLDSFNAHPMASSIQGDADRSSFRIDCNCVLAWRQAAPIAP